MKKIVFAVALCCMFSLQTLAQEKVVGKWGFEYGLEMVDPGADDKHGMSVNNKSFIYFKNFNSHRLSILYKQSIYKGIYVEPRLSYYYMKYDTDYGISISDPDYVRTYSVAVISDLVEHGIGASLHIGYNFRLYNKWSVDFFVEPDYRYAMESKMPYNKWRQANNTKVRKANNILFARRMMEL